MGKPWTKAGLLVGGWLALSGNLEAAPPTVAQMLNFQPKQSNVVFSTPSAQEQEQCKVELVNGPKGGNGWMLRDPQGRPMRRFFDSNADKKIDIWSYFHEGIEVYREVDSQFTGAVDHYRWINTNGMKWGVDSNKDGKIDSWKMISAEEVSQEILQAVITKDFDRLQTLWITDAEVKSLELAGSEADRIRDLRAQSQTKFTSTVAKLNLGPQTRWERLEISTPQCVPADQTGLKRDLIKHTRASILFETGGKHDWLHTGELIQVGMTWRLMDAPAPGVAPETGVGGDVIPANDPALQAILEELRQVDAAAPKTAEATPSANAAIMQYNLKRAQILQKVVVKVSKPEERDPWIRQLADCWSAAAQSSPENDKSAYERLAEFAHEISKAQPGSPLAAYVAFREMSAEYAGKLVNPGKDFAKIQEHWIGRLGKFVQDFPQAEDTPDALLQLGMVNEFLGKEVEAKKWYQQLAATFPDKKPLADKAIGALRRLDLEGKPIELAGTTVDGKEFNITTLGGKVVIIYYWASWNQQSVGDFARLKVLLSSLGSKGVELVCVNLDNGPLEANVPAAPGIQLAHSAGLDSPLAAQYGIMVLPNMFLVGKDGKVVSRTVQLANLDDEVKKLVGKP